MFFRHYLCKKYYKLITVQYYIANYVSWVPRLIGLNMLLKWNSFICMEHTITLRPQHSTCTQEVPNRYFSSEKLKSIPLCGFLSCLNFLFTCNPTIIIMGQSLDAIFSLEKSIYVLQGKNHAGFLTLFEIHWITAHFPILSCEGRTSPA